MSHLTVIINGDTVMNGDTGDWTHTPPTLTNDLLKGHLQPQPYSRPLLVVMADTALRHTTATITITTRDSGWTMDITN